METSKAITQAYLQIKDALSIKLGSEGYQVVHEQSDDPVFDSRYVIWSNDEDALRLMWDGKEGWFVLEVADALPLSSITAWDEIILVSYDSLTQDTNYHNEITQKIIDSLS
jgi:hypothetical protein